MNQVWRLGYTTGTCATAAAKAAAMALFVDTRPSSIEVGLLNGERVTLPVFRVERFGASATATVRKDAGDDPDVTDQLLIQTTVTVSKGNEIEFLAGEGVGIITLPGLAFPPGEPAINPGPRRQISDALREVTLSGLIVTVSIPGGSTVAERTYNPKLGVVGGLSILGTDGRVRPFSHPRLLAALKLSVDVAKANGVSVPILVPGHLGRRHAITLLRCSDTDVIEMSNEVGAMLSYCVELDYKRVVLLGHPGKLAKVISNHFDTHSSRSGSATDTVRSVAERIGIHVPRDLATTEAIFKQLAETERHLLGYRVSQEIRVAVETRFSELKVSVYLTNLTGNVLGFTGVAAPWVH
jgi:cobalt-precorrin-5B (C1)-methyltransferase